jgi:hypothetical protein
MPMTVTAGPDHSRSPRLPVPNSGSPGSTPASSRNLVFGVRGAHPRFAAQPGDGHVAMAVVKRGGRMQEDEEGVRGRAAELAAVPRFGERSHFDGSSLAVELTAQASCRPACELTG